MHMSRKILIVLALALAALLAAAAAILYQGRAGESKGVAIRDLSGRVVEVKTPVKRAVVLSVSTLEIIHLIHADGQVAGVAYEAKLDPLLPETLRSAPVVGRRLAVTDWERLVSLKPDLIIDLDLRAFYDVNGMIEKAGSYGIPVVLLREDRISQLYDTTELLGRLFGREKEAEALVSYMRKEFLEAKRIGDRIPPGERKRVVMVQPIFGKLFLVNGNDVLAEAARLVGAEYAVNITLKGYTPVRIPVEKEKLISITKDADVIVLLTSTVTPLDKVEAFKKAMLSDPAWRGVKAVKEGHVYVLRADLGEGSYLRWSPRLAVGVWQLGHTIYPRYFPDWRGKEAALLSMYKGARG